MNDPTAASEKPAFTPDHPAVVLFAELDGMAEQLLTAASMFAEIATAFARQVALAKAMRESDDGATRQ